MTIEELCYYPGYRLRELILSQKMSSKEVLDFFLNRIEKENPQIKAFLTVCDHQALQEVEKCSTRPLLGLPVALEDSLQVSGFPTTYGSLLMKDFISEIDDLEVRRLKEAGAVIIGKTNLSEFGFSPLALNQLSEGTQNPITKKTCLGSSGGAAAAVAAGCAPFAIGTDTTGGLRLPAYDCFLYGLKPTRGRIPLCRPHLVSMADKMFHQKGIIARDPRDIALLLHILAQPDRHDLDCCYIPPIDYFDYLNGKNRQKLKIGYSYNLGFLPIDHVNFDRFQQKLDSLKEGGHDLLEIPCQFNTEIFDHYKAILACDRYFPLLALKENQENFNDLLDAYTYQWFTLAQEISGIAYAGALLYAQWVREEFEKFFESFDLILTPCMPSESLDSLLGQWGFLLPFNLSGHPALVTPSGVQIIGKYYDESLVLRFSKDL